MPVFHIDMNFAAFRQDGLKRMFELAAASGAELRLRFMRAILAMLTHQPFSTAILEQDQQAFAAYLMREQTSASVVHNAELVYAPICNYLRSRR